jgi:hypothetical protein
VDFYRRSVFYTYPAFTCSALGRFRIGGGDKREVKPHEGTTRWKVSFGFVGCDVDSTQRTMESGLYVKNAV